MTAADLGRGIGSGAIDPAALTEVFLGAIATHPDRDRIYAVVTAGRARAEAATAAARARAGLRRGPLDGVPISWKDLYDSAGVATEAGSRLLAGRVPARDATVLARATRAGLVCLGKTHMTELAFSGLGLNPMTATPPNSHDPSLAPGGSSSGAAVSVALGLAAAGIGSDTGGSIRLPAAWNGLVGFKPTHGALPLDGVVPLCAAFDTVGPLARSVEDAALLTAAMAGASAPDLMAASVEGRRFLVLATVAFDGIRPLPAAAVKGALARLTAAGAVVEHAEVAAVAAAMPLSATLFAGEAYATWGETIEAAPERMFPMVLERFRSGRDVTAAALLRDRVRLEALRAEFARAVAGYDAVLLPTSPILPPDAARLLSDPAFFTTENMLALRNTRIGNLMGTCGISLPTGTPCCGLMALALPGRDRALLCLAMGIEAALART